MAPEEHMRESVSLNHNRSIGTQRASLSMTSHPLTILGGFWGRWFSVIHLDLLCCYRHTPVLVVASPFELLLRFRGSESRPRTTERRRSSSDDDEQWYLYNPQNRLSEQAVDWVPVLRPHRKLDTGDRSGPTQLTRPLAERCFMGTSFADADILSKN